MLRYLCFFADPRSAAQYEAMRAPGERLAAQGWHRIHETNALHVWSTEPCPPCTQALLQHHCILLGTVFPRPGDSSALQPAETEALDPVTFDPPTARRLANSRGTALIKEYWGDYVTIQHDLAAGITRVLKDPTGSLPCHLAPWGELLIAFSCVEDALDLGVPRFTLRHEVVHQRARLGNLYMLASPLNEVTSVLRGEWLDVAHRGGVRMRARGFAWHPHTFISRDAAIESPIRAARLLESTLHACTTAWLRQHTGALLRLSGGLDSSIIAACMADTPQGASADAYTYYDPTAARDERPWACRVARHLNLSHRCVAMHPGSADLRQLDALRPQVAQPSLLGYLQRAPLERRLTQELGSTAIMTGLGGDSLFAGDAIAYAPSEWLHYHAPSARFISLATHVARVTQWSTWSLIARALRRRAFGPSQHDNRRAMQPHTSLLHPTLRALPDEDRYPHPWFVDSRRVRWPIVRRLGELTLPSQYEWADAPPSTFSPAIVSPLYSQPVVELCLRIPLHVHFLNGVERGLARAAFAARLPPEIVNRTWKDRVPGYLEQVLSRNLTYLREHLLEGVLARSEVLDRTAVEAALHLAPSRSPTLPGDLLHLLEVELWAQHWQ